MRSRLDLLVGRIEKISRNKAAELITSGTVSVGGVTRNKPSFMASETDAIVIDAPDRFVSRSARKLSRFLDEIKIDIGGLRCLDIGAGAGGWTQVLLEKGAADVTAIDVGSNQLSLAVRSDRRVISLEKTDIRLFKPAAKFDLAVCDVSFISLEKIMDAIDNLANDHIIALFKPQFEVGRDAKRSKRGVALDTKAIADAASRFESAASRLKWVLQAKLPSTLKGKEGNLEYLLHYRKVVD
ncbi:MAG: TlyA family RNA methyltransferase [Helicobacteraceae bacterium]|jgi:23S rRNA (cytidine1920-2'-O)/16S rRNA (cytidine1409-2'-O)-methyltransferase|nr:TlyA family RNA methyltransferase [Helicobacteraceae bacterium]